MASIGDAHKTTENAQEMTLQDTVSGVYKKLVVDETGKFLLGAILVGDNSDYDALLQCYLNQTELPDHAANLLFDTSMLQGEMNDTAIICSCHNVSKGDLVSAIQAGAHDLDTCLLYTSPSPRDGRISRMPSSA